MGGKKVEGMQACQKNVFVWMPDEMIHTAEQTISADEVARQYGVPQETLIVYLGAEIQEAEACRSLPFTLMLVISYAAMAILHDDSPITRAVEDSLEYDIRYNTEFAFSTNGVIGHKVLDDVLSDDEFWDWWKIGLVNLLFDPSWEWSENYNASDPRYVLADAQDPIPDGLGLWLRYNRIVGGVRVRQERPEDPHTCETTRTLLDLYNYDCVSGLDYNIEPEAGLPTQRAELTLDPVREQWLWISDPKEVVVEQIESLQDSDWYDRATMKIEISIPVYNAEYGIHTLVFVNFYKSRGGHIWKKVIPKSQYSTWHFRWYFFVVDITWFLCVNYILASEGMEVIRKLRLVGVIHFCKEYFNVWNAIDWLTVLGGYAIFITFFASLGMRNLMNDTLIELGNASLEDRIGYQSKASTYAQALQDNVNYVRILRLLLAVYPSIIILRFFKSFAAQPRLALVTKTLSYSAVDLFHFMIVFTSVFFTFMIFGVVLFGREVRNFTTVPRALVTCFRIMFGDIDWEELRVIGRIEAGIWLWAFISVVALIMINMILAIILDNYEEIKLLTGYKETLLEEMIQVYTRWRGIQNGTTVSMEAILEGLQHKMKKQGSANNSALFKMQELFRPKEDLEPAKSDVDLSMSLASNGATEATQTDNTIDFSIENRGKPKGDGVCKDTKIIKVPELMSSVKMPAEQAVEVIRGAIEDYHERNKHGAELEELLLLTQKCDLRVKKCAHLARQAVEVRDMGSVTELSWFGEELKKYLKAVKKEREERHHERERLTRLKQDFQELLVQLPPSAVFPLEPADDGPNLESLVSNVKNYVV